MEPRFVIGPVFSHGGFKNWDLLLFEDRLVTVPKGIWTSIHVGLFAGISSGLATKAAQRESRKAKAPEAPALAAYPTYTLDQIYGISVRRKLASASEIRVKTAKKELVFGVYDRSRLDEYEKALQQSYPGLFKAT